MKSRIRLIGIIGLLTAFLSAGCQNTLPVDNKGDGGDVFVPVTNIIGVQTSVLVGTVSLSATVVPDNATNKKIRWSVVDDDDTDATISGNILSTKVEGTIVIRATVFDGIAEGVKFTKNFTIFIDPFVPVTSITPTFPSSSKVGELYLNAIVRPYDASYTDILWTVKDAGTTLGRIKRGDDTLTTSAEGTIVITATIVNGLADGKDFADDFSIEIKNPPKSP